MTAGFARRLRTAVADERPVRATRRRLRESLAWRARRFARTPGVAGAEAAALRAATRVAPQSARVYRRLAVTELLRDEARAVAAWSRVLELDPDDLDARIRCAEALWALGEWADSLRLWADWDRRRQELAAARLLDRLPVTVFGRTFTKRIGHTALLDMHVKDVLLAGKAPNRSVVVSHSEAIMNRAYLDYFGAHVQLAVVDHRSYEALVPLLELVEMSMQAWRRSSGQTAFYEPVGHEVEREWEHRRRRPLLEVSPDHLEWGRSLLAGLGMPEGAWFVTLHVREAAYQTTRNARPESYRRAIETIVERGGWVVRIGDPSTTPLPAMEHVIDFAHVVEQPDWMNVFLLGACRFMLGTQSGPFQVPGTFGVPAIHTNWHPLPYRYWFGRDLMLPKLYRSRRAGRFLTYPEVATSRVAGAMDIRTLAREDVELVDNTPEEIDAAVREMLDRLDGVPEAPDPADEELQRRFDSLPFPLPYRLPPGGARVAATFLRAHSELL